MTTEISIPVKYIRRLWCHFSSSGDIDELERKCREKINDFAIKNGLVLVGEIKTVTEYSIELGKLITIVYAKAKKI